MGFAVFKLYCGRDYILESEKGSNEQGEGRKAEDEKVG